MTNRREILQAAAVSALPLVTRATGIADVAVPKPLTLHAFLIDERHAAARSVGARFAARGIPVHAIPGGDITQIWLRQIGPIWSRTPVAVAGLTERPALFCLEQFALASGLRVAFHGEHVTHRHGRTEHSLLRGSEESGLGVHDLRRAGPLWPARLADAIATHRERPMPARFGRSEAALAPTLPPGAQLLTSWIIAAA